MEIDSIENYAIKHYQIGKYDVWGIFHGKEVMFFATFFSFKISASITFNPFNNFLTACN